MPRKRHWLWRWFGASGFVRRIESLLFLHATKVECATDSDEADASNYRSHFGFLSADENQVHEQYEGSDADEQQRERFPNHFGL